MTSSSTSDSRLASCDGVTYTEKTGQGDETRLPPGFDIIYPVITKREQISRIYTFNNNTRVSTKHCSYIHVYQTHNHSNLFETNFLSLFHHHRLCLSNEALVCCGFVDLFVTKKKLFREEPSTQEWKVQLEQSIIPDWLFVVYFQRNLRNGRTVDILS